MLRSSAPSADIDELLAAAEELTYLLMAPDCYTARDSGVGRAWMSVPARAGNFPGARISSR